MNEVVLIIPKDDSAFSPLVYPPLGLLYVAAMLERHFVVNIYDMREPYNTMETIPEADIYGFTATTFQIDDVISISQYLKSKRNSPFTVIGGSHASYLPHALLKHFNAIIVGEAESEVCDIFMARKSGIFYPKPGDINNIPFPSRHLMPEERVISTELWEGYGYGNGPKATTIISSRGCPWKCSFCANIPQKIRFRNADNFVSEIEHIGDKYSCRHFRFIDDNFITNRKRLYEISKKLKPLNVKFRCAGRSDLINEQICEALLEAGCEEIGLGIESANDDILKLLNKNETVADHRRAIQVAKRCGLRTKGFFMAGLPGETWESIQKNKDFIQEVELDKVIVTLFTPYPGCALWNNPDKFDIEILENNWSEYYQTYPSKSAIRTAHVSREELTEHFNEFVKSIRKTQKL